MCFKAAITNANGEALPEYDPNGTGYDVWVKNPKPSDWVQTHTADETYLNSRHLFCGNMSIEEAKITCESHTDCNGFNFRASDNTVCFKAADTNENGETMPEYHPTGTGYQVWIQNPQTQSTALSANEGIPCFGVNHSTNMTEACAAELWLQAGCTTFIDHTPWRDWARSMNLNFNEMKNDVHLHATMMDEAHRNHCQSEAQLSQTQDAGPQGEYVKSIRMPGKVYYLLDGTVYPIDQATGSNCAANLPADKNGLTPDQASELDVLAHPFSLGLVGGHRIGSELKCELPNSAVQDSFREIRFFNMRDEMTTRINQAPIENLDDAKAQCMARTDCIAVTSDGYLMAAKSNTVTSVDPIDGLTKYSVNGSYAIGQFPTYAVGFDPDTSATDNHTVFVPTHRVNPECPAGYFAPREGYDAACAPCPAGTVSSPGATSLNKCRACSSNPGGGYGHGGLYKPYGSGLGWPDGTWTTHRLSTQRQMCTMVPSRYELGGRERRIHAPYCRTQSSYDQFMSHRTGQTNCSHSTWERESSWTREWHQVSAVYGQGMNQLFMQPMMRGIGTMWNAMKAAAEWLFVDACELVVGKGSAKASHSMCARSCVSIGTTIAARGALNPASVFAASVTTATCTASCAKMVDEVVNQSGVIENMCQALGNELF